MVTEDDIRKALDRYSSTLGDLPNVRGFGVAEKTVGGQPSGKLSLVIYVTKKVPPKELGRGERLPETVDIVDEHGTKKSISVDVVELGDLSFEGA